MSLPLALAALGVAKRTEHAAIALIRLEQAAAAFAFIKELARVHRHFFSLRVPALRTGNRRILLHRNCPEKSCEVRGRPQCVADLTDRRDTFRKSLCRSPWANVRDTVLDTDIGSREPKLASLDTQFVSHIPYHPDELLTQRDMTFRG